MAAILSSRATAIFPDRPADSGYYASKYGVDVDLLTRGAGFGYIGSTITSLIYATFTFILFSMEAVDHVAGAGDVPSGVPLWVGYIISAVVVIPMVTYGIRLISGLQLMDPAGLARAAISCRSSTSR